jgi:hypothetical protein
MMRAVMFGLGFWLMAAMCSAESAFDGKWTGTFFRPTGGNQDVTITIRTDQGGRVTGSMTLQGVDGEVPIQWGYVKDDLITYRVKVPGQAGTLLFVYLGKVSGDQIDFGRRPEDLTVGLLVKGKATRMK